MRVLLDTNRYRDFCTGEAVIVQALRQADEIFMPFVTLAELRSGFACGTKSATNASILTRFLNRPRVRALYSDEETTHHYANLFRQLRQQGTPIPTNDLWLAALAVQHDLLLASRDGHFAHLPQVPCI